MPDKKMSAGKVDSWEQLQAQVADILEQLNADPALAMAAAVNPLYALEELGYEINAQTRAEIEDRVRFQPRTVVRLRQLRQAVHEHAGRSFDLNSTDELQTVLFDELKLDSSYQKAAQKPTRRRALPDTSPLPTQVSWAEKVEEPLEPLRGAHPIMEPLLEYRRLDASQPRLAPRDIYQEVRTGKRQLPIRRIRARLQSQPD